MLRKDLQYVCIDFETTGLDPENDEAIQVGIVSFDFEGKEIDSFSSYIKPQKPISELKDMVRVITGLSLTDVAEAPTFADVMPHVARFFTEKTVIVGHNIQFDLKVLKQHMKVSAYAIIDTFPLTQSLMPFSASYALEVLDKSLTQKANTEETTTKHHDALYDAQATKRVFLAACQRLEKVIAHYPHVSSYISRSSSPLKSILSLSSEQTLDGGVPILTKTLASDKKLITNDTVAVSELADKGNYYIGNMSLKETLKKLPKENVIYAFSQRHKTQIAKNILHEIGLTHIDTGGHFIFDKKLLSLFFHKSSFDEQELYFAIKYYFHAFSQHSTIDLNSPTDWKIYHALKEKQSKGENKSAEILTHEQLYERLREQDIMPYTSIFFFDQDRWYDTHMKWEGKPFDIYTLLQITDSLIYRDQLLLPGKTSAWTLLHTKLVIFLGIWQTEVAGLLKDVSNSTVEIDSIIDNTYFYKTNLLLGQLSETIENLEGKVLDDDLIVVSDKWKRFREIIANVCSISTKLQGDEIHFIVKSSSTYLEYSEFKQLFEIYQTTFLSITKKDWPTLGNANNSLGGPSVLPWPGKQALGYENNNIYVFSNSKQTSQDLLVWLHSHKPEKHKVHGENITGGKGKNIFAIKGSTHNVIIGGYDFFLQCIAQKIKIDVIYTLAITGPLQHIISADLLFYGNNHG